MEVQPRGRQGCRGPHEFAHAGRFAERAAVADRARRLSISAMEEMSMKESVDA
ncbi:hypothetical protein LP420_33485 [Massilia sp. B-10]|nr:hypothetical protein LP420_33485 [Massilia sp. B-10]UUZ53527.1 hypothetical protein LP419_32960 [Massilia sp. H-1]